MSTPLISFPNRVRFLLFCFVYLSLLRASDSFQCQQSLNGLSLCGGTSASCINLGPRSATPHHAGSSMFFFFICTHLVSTICVFIDIQLCTLWRYCYYFSCSSSFGWINLSKKKKKDLYDHKNCIETGSYLWFLVDITYITYQIHWAITQYPYCIFFLSLLLPHIILLHRQCSVKKNNISLHVTEKKTQSFNIQCTQHKPGM